MAKNTTLHVKKDDKVVVLAGKEKGNTGKVLYTLPKKNRVAIQGLNLIKRHARPSEKNPSGGIMEKEAPMDASNVALLCPKCGEKIRARRHVLADGKVMRKCPACNEVYP